MFGDALSTPAKTSDAAVTLFIGGVLTLFAVVGPLVAVAGLSVSLLALLVLPFGVIPALVLRGYYVAVIADGAHREPGAPSIVRWGKLLSDGVKSVLVTVGYLLPAVLLVVLALGALVALVPPEVADPATPATSPSAVESSTSDARALGALAVLVLGSLLLLGYALLYAYLRPAALAVFAVSGSLREAFRLGRVRSVAGTGDFAVGWLLAGLVLTIGGFFVLPLSVLLVGFFLLFYLQVVAHSLYGRGASDVLVPVTESALEEVGDGDELEDAGTGTDSDTDADSDTDTDAGTNSHIDTGTDSDSNVDADSDSAIDPATEPADDEAGFPSEWGVESTEFEETETIGDGVEVDSPATESEQADDALTDWDDVSDAVESSASTDVDDSKLGTSAGGVSPAVQSGRGLPVNGTDHTDDTDHTDGTDSERPETISTDTTDDTAETDDPFDWGPADGR